jgi:aspartyl-tRNA(Asn)/glutamyl-tRNA(Gln) amidotransferase subunit A
LRERSHRRTCWRSPPRREAILHAYLTIDHDGSRAAAAAADAALGQGRDLGPLHGIPIALKDNMVTRGIETTCSSRILAGYRPPYDATVVERLKAGGAVIFGEDQPRRVRHG